MKKSNMTPPLSDEAQETKLVALALREAQKEMEAGTASSQLLTHFVRLGTTKHREELNKLKLENELLAAKIQSEKNGQQLNEMFSEVIAALKSYSYNPPGGS